MNTRAPQKCALTWCDTGLPARMYVVGKRCEIHTPAAMAGEIEPDAVAAKARAIREAFTRSREPA